MAVAAAVAAMAAGCGGGSTHQSGQAPSPAAGAGPGTAGPAASGGGFEVLGPTGPGGAGSGSSGASGASPGSGGGTGTGTFVPVPGGGSAGPGGGSGGGPSSGTGTGSAGDPSVGGPGGGVQVLTPPANPVAAINEAYYVFMTSVSGIDDDFNGGWVSELQQVAEPAVVDAAKRAAGTLESAREHGVGTLRDDHRALHINPAAGRATLTDCLDEYNWYVVSDSTGQPDPGVARGYFEGTGTFVESAGRWLVESWRSEPTKCQF